MNALAIPIVHPSYENLKRKGRSLHLIAGILILLNSIHELQTVTGNQLYFWCELFIGIDILIMVFTSPNLALGLPGINTVFRLIECLLFMGAASILLLESSWVPGMILLLISGAYAYLLYCERKILQTEQVAFHHIGITISALPSSQFFLWSRINNITARYDSIIIETSENKTFQFKLRKNLQFAELDQIHEFCRHYLKTSD